MEILKDIPNDVTLVAVSKTKPIEMIKECYDIGQRDFGENKVQDLIAKKELLPKDIRWHFIGKLQTNKVKYLVNNVYLIHSLSSIKLLEKIESEFSKNNSSVNALIQINIGREESKSGIYEEELEDMIKAIEACNHVKVKGIKAPYSQEFAEKMRPEGGGHRGTAEADDLGFGTLMYTRE